MNINEHNVLAVWLETQTSTLKCDIKRAKDPARDDVSYAIVSATHRAATSHLSNAECQSQSATGWRKTRV
ncbi:unnamed protein product [Pieris brassicae]|uniref:Uncharacterized protein n=1 Tax=Pieris brassicae TaxID=7116 RepID=A0A9P0XK27_PIEBR|nr:unnamed protein product [Pieris brassicae]